MGAESSCKYSSRSTFVSGNFLLYFGGGLTISSCGLLSIEVAVTAVCAHGWAGSFLPDIP